MEEQNTGGDLQNDEPDQHKGAFQREALRNATFNTSSQKLSQLSPYKKHSPIPL